MATVQTWIWEIKSEKQPNGMFGMPTACIYMDKMPHKDSDWEKHSALCIGIAEAYPGETFEIHFTDVKGFLVKLNKSGWKKISFADYELHDNILTWVGSSLQLEPPIRV